MRDVTVPDALDVDRSFGVEGLHALRSTVAAHASQAGASVTLVDALVIVVGELATNAIRHGGGSGRLRLWHGGDHVFVQLTDEGPGLADPDAGRVRPALDQEGGRGLWVVRSLSADVVIDRGPAGTGARVTAILRW